VLGALDEVLAIQGHVAVSTAHDMLLFEDVITDEDWRFPGIPFPTELKSLSLFNPYGSSSR
jgi:hypothetical protein